MSQRHIRPEELLERLDSMADRLDDVETHNEQQSRELQQANQRITALETENEELRETVADQDEEIDALHRERVRLARRLTAVEEQHDIDPSTAKAFGDGKTTSPLYLLESIGPEAVADAPGTTLYRARVLVENRDRWGEVRQNAKFGRHRLLATKAHDLKQRLEDARDEELQWGQVYPALKKLASLGGDHVQYVEEYSTPEKDYGKAVVWQEVDSR